MDSKTTPARLIYLDLLRIIAIFAMMLLHVAAINWYVLPVTSLEWQVLNVYDSLVRFCVPVMFMISGALFLDPNRPVAFRKLFKTNLFRLLTAFVFWSFLYALAYHVWRYGTINVQALSSLIEATILGHYHLWFLVTLMGLYLIVPLLRKICESQAMMQYFLVLSFLFAFTLNFILVFFEDQTLIEALLTKLGLYVIMGYSSYFVLGSYLVRYELSHKMKHVIYALGITAMMVTISGTSWLSVNQNQPVSSLYNYLQLTTFLSSAAIFVLVKERSKHIQWSTQAQHYMSWLSKLSFGMYLSHDFVNILFREVLNFTSTSFHPILAVPVITILVFFISLVVSWILNKIPIINKFFV